MKYGWKLIIAPLWVLCVAGAALVAFFAFGWYSWIAFALAGGIGLAVGIPAGVWTTRKLRRDDPHWRAGHPVTDNR
ncbi:hypothetical protein N4R57_09260 [Rhodobacteraceae bacterium D3-12]|nr:hypothetical protein N4R57_09260 [Rhodobacteraceae bacterium D3-12]